MGRLYAASRMTGVLALLGIAFLAVPSAPSAPAVAPPPSASAAAAPARLVSDPIDFGRPAIRAFTDRDGLPQNSAMAMAIDARGYLWVATQDGLATYNGRSWTVINMPNRTVSNFVRSMIISSDGSIWCGRENGGVARLLNGEWSTWNASTGFPEGAVGCVFESNTATNGPVIWAGTSSGLVRFDGERWMPVGAESGLRGLRVREMVELPSPDGSATLWAATNAGLVRLDGDQWKPVALPVGSPGDSVESLAVTTRADGARSLWAGTGTGHIARLEPSGGWVALELQSPETVTCLAETESATGEKVMWAGTDGGGIHRYQNGSWRAFDTRAGMPNNTFWCLLPVRGPRGTPTLWMGTDGGVGRLQLGRWTSFDEKLGLPTDSAYALCETVDDDGTRSIWIGTRGGGLARLRDGQWTVFTTNDGLPNNTIFSLAEFREADGRRWLIAGTQGGGIARFENGRWRTLPIDIPGFEARTVRRLVPSVDLDGTPELWAATGGGGVLRYRNGEWSVLGVASGLPTGNLFTVTPAPALGGRRAIWVGTQGYGVARWLDGSWTVFDTSNSTLPNNSVLSLHATKGAGGRNVLWAGTEGGGAALLDLDADDATWTVIDDSTATALPNNTVYQIREDATRRLYLTTNRGAARLSPRTPTPDDPAEFRVETFTTEDGLPSNEFNGGSSVIDSTGRIWAGTPAGVAVFDPSSEVVSSDPKPLYIERQHLNDADREIDREIAAGESLAYDENNLSFEFALLSYFRERETRYRTQLVGLDEAPSEWNADSKASYRTLPAGAYTFRVWARDYAGNVAGPVEVAFEVRPAPWLTWWAFVLYIAAIGIAGYGIVRYRLNALRRRNLELEEGIAERTVQLAEKVDELEVSERQAQRAKEDALEAREEALEATRAKSVFLSNMSHELRTPLNAVLGFAQLMEREPERSGEDRENLGVIVRSGEHLLGLINDVLSISKIEAGKLTLNEQVFDLGRMLQGIEDMIGVRARAKSLRFVIDEAPGVPQLVRGDEGKLRQVLINLLGNAVKFTDAGGVALRVRWEGGRAEFEIEDTGQGIAEAEVGQIFDAFVQSESGRSAKEGTGLGLAISRNFVNLMGGDIDVRSELGRGTVFRFEIDAPAAEEAELPRAQRRVIGLEPGQTVPRVLVADDRYENRVLLMKLLASIGFEVLDAADGRQAVDSWLAWHPQLVWMDMRMPVMDGSAATREIRRIEAAKGVSFDDRTRVLALTASAFEHERSAVLAAGCDDFVTKPYRDTTIFEKLVEHLGVRFTYEGEDARIARESEEREDVAITSARLGSLPSQLASDLHSALMLGNPKGAQAVIEAIADHDEPLADELRRLVKNYEFDEIIDAIEAAGLSSA